MLSRLRRDGFSVPLGLVVGTVSYVVVYKSVEVYQRRRRNKLADKGAGKHGRLFPAPGNTVEEDGSA